MRMQDWALLQVVTFQELPQQQWLPQWGRIRGRAYRPNLMRWRVVIECSSLSAQRVSAEASSVGSYCGNVLQSDVVRPRKSTEAVELVFNYNLLHTLKNRKQRCQSGAFLWRMKKTDVKNLITYKAIALSQCVQLEKGATIWAEIRGSKRRP